MKKNKLSNLRAIIVITCPLLILPLGVYAQSCSNFPLNNVDDVAHMQACLVNLQKELEIILEDQNKIILDTTNNAEVLFKQEANCTEIEKNYRINPAITEVMVKDCELRGIKLAIQWSQAGARIKNLRENQNLTKQHIEALKLKLIQIQTVAERFRESKK